MCVQEGRSSSLRAQIMDADQYRQFTATHQVPPIVLEAVYSASLLPYRLHYAIMCLVQTQWFLYLGLSALSVFGPFLLWFNIQQTHENGMPKLQKSQ